MGMSKKHLSRVSIFSCAMVLAALALGSCLNPISFDINSLPRIPVEVTGSISINDTAVLWLINRTKTVEIREFTVSRPRGDNEAAEDYKYPKKTMDKPGPGSSLASYHIPTAAEFTLTIVCRDTEDDTTGVLGPYTVQFPRAQDYRYYLYWTIDGEIVLINEDRMEELPPDPDPEVNFSPSPPSNAAPQTLAVLNVTLDQDLNSVEFKKESAVGGDVIYLLEDRPLAEDQARVLLDTGSYAAKAAYTDKNGVPQTINKTAIVTKEEGGMAGNYLFFYKVKGGGYDLSPTWPPLSNDAAGENSVIGALTDTQGILQVTNKAKGTESIDSIQKIRIKDKINDKEYPADGSSGPYMLGGEVNQYIVEEGAVSVFFKPMDPYPYGGVISRTIKAKQITALNYTGALADSQDQEPPSGQGLIRITNNSTAPVVKVMVYNRAAPDKFQTIDYDKFIPSGGIGSGSTGRVLAGGSDFPLNSSYQVIKVQLTTPKGPAVVERLAFLSGKIVDVAITEDSLYKGQSSDDGIQMGAKITVKNNTAASVVGIRIYDKAKPKDSPDSSWIFPLDIPPGGTRSFQIPRTSDFPIEEDAQYAAELVVVGYGEHEGFIEKQFEEGGGLYSSIPDSPVRTVTLNQGDLVPGMVFKAVESIGTAAPYKLVSSTEKNDVDEEVLKAGGGGTVNLSHGIGLQFTPANASKKSPIKWSVKSAHTDYVSVNNDGVLMVKGVAPSGNRIVTLQAVIEGAGENEEPFTGTVPIELVYDLKKTITIYFPW
jgi:hypothetical protein